MIVYLAIGLAIGLLLLATVAVALAFRLSTENADLVRTLATGPRPVQPPKAEPYPPVAPGDLFRGFDPNYDR